MEKHWSDAKLPKWVVESIEKEMKAQRLTSALSWPTEAKPEPLPFRWGDYEMCYGDPVPGTYYGVEGRFSVRKVSIRTKQSDDAGWKTWRFDIGSGFSSSVFRGPLFETEKDAKLYALWMKCEECAAEILYLRERLY